MDHKPSPAYPANVGAPHPQMNNYLQYQEFPIQQHPQQSLPGAVQQIIPKLVRQGSANQYNAPQQYTPPPVNYNQQQSFPYAYSQPSPLVPQLHQQQQPGIQYYQPQTPFGYNYNQQPYQQQHGGYVQVQPIQRNSQQNNYSQSEILEIQTFFYQVAGIDRNIDRQEFIQIILLAYPNLKNLPQLHGFFENLFRQCDLNNNGYIDLKEFMIGYKRVSDQLEDMNNQYA
jgi:hypothetical protein